MVASPHAIPVIGRSVPFRASIPGYSGAVVRLEEACECPCCLKVADRLVLAVENHLLLSFCCCLFCGRTYCHSIEAGEGIFRYLDVGRVIGRPESFVPAVQTSRVKRTPFNSDFRLMGERRRAGLCVLCGEEASGGEGSSVCPSCARAE